MAQVFITSDQDDGDADEAVSFKYGEPRNHRLLGAVTEVNNKKNTNKAVSVIYSRKLLL